MNLKKEAVSVFKSILKNVNPKEFLPEIVSWNQETGKLRIHDTEFSVASDQKIYVIGTGKASPTMAEAMENILGEVIEDGLIIAPPDSESDLQIINMVQGSHPLPDANSIQATHHFLKLIKTIPDGSVVINLLSGGTSALLCRPVEHITVHDIREVFRLLLESGATIHEINTVRKTISQIKGGQLLKYFENKTLIDLIISDVPDDDLRYIGSGPTTAQKISYQEAFDVLNRYEIWESLSKSVKDHILSKKESAENRKFESKEIEHHEAWIVSSASKVAKQTKQILTDSGFETELVHPAWTGLINDFEEHIFGHIEKLREMPAGNHALVFYGECTVKVTGDGLGGRNQELALRMALRLQNMDNNIAFLSAGTDGIDGPTDAAGGVVDKNTFSEAEEKSLEPNSYIEANDSYHFFEKFGGHIITGPTGNNVMDIQIVLMQKS